MKGNKLLWEINSELYTYKRRCELQNCFEENGSFICYTSLHNRDGMILARAYSDQIKLWGQNTSSLVRFNAGGLIRLRLCERQEVLGKTALAQCWKSHSRVNFWKNAS